MWSIFYRLSMHLHMYLYVYFWVSCKYLICLSIFYRYLSYLWINETDTFMNKRVNLIRSDLNDIGTVVQFWVDWRKKEREKNLVRVIFNKWWWWRRFVKKRYPRRWEESQKNGAKTVEDKSEGLTRNGENKVSKNTKAGTVWKVHFSFLINLNTINCN